MRADSTKMSLTVDLSELVHLQKKLSEVHGYLSQKGVLIEAMKNACKPCLMVMKANTPDSGMMPYIPKSKNGDRAYQRGGHALKNSARIRTTKFKVYAQTQVLVGYSKGSNKAGWRAHFIEYGYFHADTGSWIAPKPWIRRAEQSTAKIVEELFEVEVQRTVDKLF
jgi:hypothetical protein